MGNRGLGREVRAKKSPILSEGIEEPGVAGKEIRVSDGTKVTNAVPIWKSTVGGGWAPGDLVTDERDGRTRGVVSRRLSLEVKRLTPPADCRSQVSV